MIGLVLVVDGLGVHIPKGYVYAAIGFAVLVEILNQLAAANRSRAHPDASRGSSTRCCASSPAYRSRRRKWWPKC
jgi:hypothetical protein